MKREEAVSILADVRAYLASRACGNPNAELAGHRYAEICNAILFLINEPHTVINANAKEVTNIEHVDVLNI